MWDCVIKTTGERFLPKTVKHLQRANFRFRRELKLNSKVIRIPVAIAAAQTEYWTFLHFPFPRNTENIGYILKFRFLLELKPRGRRRQRERQNRDGQVI